MKKLKLKALELGATEMLTREQLKNVLGGTGSITTTNNQACVASINCGTSDKPNLISCGCTAGGSCDSDSTSVTCKCTGEEEEKASCPSAA